MDEFEILWPAELDHSVVITEAKTQVDEAIQQPVDAEANHNGFMTFAVPAAIVGLGVIVAMGHDLNAKATEQRRIQNRSNRTELD